MRLTVLGAFIVGLALTLYFWFGFGPDIEPHRVFRSGNPSDMARGWEVLHPRAAWPIVAAYSVPVFVVAAILAWLMRRAFMADERRAIARREKAAAERMREANRLMQEAKRARERDQAVIANVKRDDMRLSRQAGKDRGQRISAVGESKRRREREDKMREQLAAAHREIERLKRALPPQNETQ